MSIFSIQSTQLFLYLPTPYTGLTLGLLAYAVANTLERCGHKAQLRTLRNESQTNHRLSNHSHC